MTAAPRTSRAVAAALVALAAAVPGGAAGASDGGDGGGDGGPRGCAVDDARLTEASGLTTLPGRPDLLLAHDDSGDSGRLVVLRRDTCEVLADPSLSGVDVVDVEDVDTAAAAEGGPLVVLADTGDNERRRDEVALLLLRPGDRPEEAAALDVRRVVVRLPEGPADVEAVVVDDAGTTALLVQKTLSERAALWAVALDGAGTVEAVQVATARLSGSLLERPVLQVTAADLAPDGSALVLRTYVDTRVWELDDGDADLADRVASALEASDGQVVATPPQPQGEAVAWVADGLLLLSEGMPAPLDLVVDDVVGRRAAPPGGRSGSVTSPAPSGAGPAGTSPSASPSADASGAGTGDDGGRGDGVGADGAGGAGDAVGPGDALLTGAVVLVGAGVLAAAVLVLRRRAARPGSR